MPAVGMPPHVGQSGPDGKRYTTGAGTTTGAATGAGQQGEEQGWNRQPQQGWLQSQQAHPDVSDTEAIRPNRNARVIMGMDPLSWGKGTEQPSSDPSEVVGIHSEWGGSLAPRGILHARLQARGIAAAVPLPVRCDNALWLDRINRLRCGFGPRRPKGGGLGATG